MAEKDLNVAFTDEKYATKQEVANVYGSSLITDSLWVKISEYRKQYRLTLSLTDTRKTPYFLTLTPRINSKISNAFTKLNETLTRINKLKNESTSLYNKFVSLKNKEILSKILNDTNTNFVASILNGTANNLKGLEEDKDLAIGYYNAISNLFKTKELAVDEDSLINLYMDVSRNYELTTLYRRLDLMAKKSLIARDFNGVPSTYIDIYMNQLFKFIEDDKYYPLTKGIISFFDILMIKPFEKYNELLGLLLFKKILFSSSYDENIYLLPFEYLLKDANKVNKILNDVIKTNDITYLAMYFVELIDRIYIETLDLITNINLKEAVEEKRQPEEEFETLVDEIKEDVVITDTTEVEEISPKSTIKPTKKKENLDTPTVSREQIAISTSIPTIDEKDAQRFEEYLLESDPMLRKTQAHFYARHCSLGKYYTIQQFKKMEKVVYETARTSMDMLAKLGYYKKEQIKNKFVYTPIERK